MKQIFLLGASSIYGVGGENGGWGEVVKQTLHRTMYAAGGVGEQYEVFNFALSGATAQFVTETFPEQIRHYGREGGAITSIVSVGGNDSRAVGTPDNFVSSVEEYIEKMGKLLVLLEQHSQQVIVVGNTPVDESKTSPKPSPFGSQPSYFTNARRQEFVAALQSLCEARKISFVSLDIDTAEWQQRYLYEDGLHPNSAGHQLLADAVLSALEPSL